MDNELFGENEDKQTLQHTYINLHPREQTTSVVRMFNTLGAGEKKVIIVTISSIVSITSPSSHQKWKNVVIIINTLHSFSRES